MSTFGWIVLVIFALIGFAVVFYAFCEFTIVQVRMFHTKIASELEVMREDNKKAKEQKRFRASKKRDAQHAAKTEILNAKLANLQKKTDVTVSEIEKKAQG